MYGHQPQEQGKTGFMFWNNHATIEHLRQLRFIAKWTSLNETSEPLHCLPQLRSTLPEFILETSYPSRGIIRQTDNSSKYKSESEFCSITYLETTAGKKTLRRYRNQSLSCGKFVKKTVYVPSRYKFRDG